MLECKFKPVLLHNAENIENGLQDQFIEGLSLLRNIPLVDYDVYDVLFF